MRSTLLLRMTWCMALYMCMHTLSSQELKGRITGNDAPLRGASVTLFDSINQQRLSAVTDSNGLFRISSTMRYPAVLTITFAGYRPYQRTIASKISDIGTIGLQMQSGLLKDVTVVSETKPITLKDGNLEYNVNSSITAQDGDALDVLRKVPGVQVDNDSRISLQGRASPMVMIDGRPTYLSGKELTDLLRAMSSSQIKSVEVITSPGAKYDAAGGSGIIHIKTNRSMQRGLSATLNAGLLAGVTAKQTTNLSFQYRRDKLTFTGAYNHFIGHYYYEYGANRLQSAQAYNSATDDVDKRNRFGARIGIDYAIDPKHTIGVLLNSNFVIGGGRTDTRTQIGTATAPASGGSLYAINDYYHQRTERYTWSLNYRYDNGKGNTLGIDADLGSFDKGNGNLQSNTYYDAGNQFIRDNRYHSLTGIDIDLWAVKMDYTQPLLRGTLEAGMKYSSVTAANATQFYYRLPSKDSMDERRTNTFRFEEKIAAAYVSYKKTSGKWDYQFGVRAEQTRSEGTLRFRSNGKDSLRTITRSYTDLFPSFSLGYRPAAGHIFSLQYARRLDRPAYQDLNPFIYLLDELSFWQGDPFLQPQYAHRFSLQYAYKSTTVVQLSYAHVKGYSANITDTIDQNKVVMVPRNLGVQRVAAVSVTQLWKPLSWWDVQATAMITMIRNDIAFDVYRQLNLRQWAARLNVQQNISLPKSFSLEVSGYLQSKKLVSANEFVRGLGQIDLAVQKRFSNGRGSVRIAVTDVLRTATTHSVQEFSGFRSVNYGYYENRLLRIGLSWKLVDPNAKAARARSSALEGEEGRIK